MKEFLLLLIVFICSLGEARAQKFGYVDSEYILSQLPDYKKAEDEINRLAQSWQVEIESMQADVGKLRDDFFREEVLLTDKMKTERLEEIRQKETELKDYQKKIFGFEGLFFLKKQELIQPLQDKIFEAIKRVAKSNKLSIVFDKAGELVMLYTDPTHDYTDFVLEELGLGDSNDTVK